MALILHHVHSMKVNTVFQQIVSADTILFLKVGNVEIVILFPHYGNFLLHKLNRIAVETIEGWKLFKGGNYSRKYGMRKLVTS